MLRSCVDFGRRIIMSFDISITGADPSDRF